LKGRHFDDTHDIWSNTTAAVKAIPQNHFQNCFEGFVASQGEYFEGDYSDIQQ
jgi:hypothetical protein